MDALSLIIYGVRNVLNDVLYETMMRQIIYDIDVGMCYMLCSMGARMFSRINKMEDRIDYVIFSMAAGEVR